MEQPDDLLQAVALAIAGDSGCCLVFDPDGRCCMTDRARQVLVVIEETTGVSLATLEIAYRNHHVCGLCTAREA